MCLQGCCPGATEPSIHVISSLNKGNLRSWPHGLMKHCASMASFAYFTVLAWPENQTVGRGQHWNAKACNADQQRLQSRVNVYIYIYKLTPFSF